MHNPKSQNCDRASVKDARYFNAESVTVYPIRDIRISEMSDRVIFTTMIRDKTAPLYKAFVLDGLNSSRIWSLSYFRYHSIRKNKVDNIKTNNQIKKNYRRSIV